MSGEPVIVDRRVTLQWLFGAMAAASLPGCATPPVSAGATAPADGSWPDVATAVTGPGYGTDPKLLEGAVPWPKTLSAAQLETAAALCDTILPAEGMHPAPSAIGIHQFVDEWVSAPYPDQARDRQILLNGFAWIEAQSAARHDKAYAKLGEAERAAILLEASRAHAKGSEFLNRMKFLTTGAYYTSEQGISELGYVGNEAISGDYPGPTAEALAHLDQLLTKLNLKRKGSQA